ncbi:MAG TPA: hypothetical protein P5081_19410 [Phycisphaerae bacterium]|nr:hypothetical protein [Phycisphaerae bacterium]HRW55044.1 hypothetical protein [Phycisphaerae bacterium]
MYRGSGFGAMVFAAVAVVVSMGATCVATFLPKPEVDLSDVQFSRFEYQVVRFSDESPDNCLASIGIVQRAIITRLEDGLLLELWLLDEGESTFGGCEANFSNDRKCRVIRAEPPRFLTQDELQVVVAAVDSMKTREEAGESTAGGLVEIPCFRKLFTRDGVTYDSPVLEEDVYPTPYLSYASVSAISRMLETLGGAPEIVSGGQ